MAKQVFKKCAGIYCIQNLVNGKKYIGSSKNINERIRSHKCMLKHNRHHSSHLQHSYNKYGKTNFIYSIVEYCKKDELFSREGYWITEYNSLDRTFGYNMSTVNENGGTVYTPELIQMRIEGHDNKEYYIFKKDDFTDNKTYTRKELRKYFSSSTIKENVSKGSFGNFYIFSKENYTGCKLLSLLNSLPNSYKTYLFDLNGKLIKEFDSLAACGRFIGITDKAVRKIIANKGISRKKYYISDSIHFTPSPKKKKKKTGGRKKRGVVVEGVRYKTIESASKELGVPVGRIYNWLHTTASVDAYYVTASS